MTVVNSRSDRRRRIRSDRRPWRRVRWSGFGGGGFAAGADVAGGMVGAPAGQCRASTDHFADHLPAVTGDHLPADDHRPAVHHPDASVLGHEMGMPDTGRMPDAVRLSDAVRMSDDRWMPDSRWMPQPCAEAAASPARQLRRVLT